MKTNKHEYSFYKLRVVLAAQLKRFARSYEDTKFFYTSSYLRNFAQKILPAAHVKLLKPLRIRFYSCSFVGKFFFIAVLCSLLLPHIAAACAFANAEYIPDPKDIRTSRDYYYYKIAVTPDLRFVLNIINPLSKEAVTRMNMQYAVDREADPAAILWLSKTESLEVEFFTQSMLQMAAYNGTSEAPAIMILRDSYSKFLTLDDDGLDIDYLTTPKVKPGAEVEGHLELIPDVWVLSGCLK